MMRWMTTRLTSIGSRRRGLLARLRADIRGNTLAIAAAAFIPLAGMIGGGLDLARMYIVKTRLQHACDAGALSGRKAMGSGQWSYSNYAARTAAERFFDANIATDAYGSTSITKTFTESAGRVTGTASAIVPMTLMRIFGKTTETLTVVCDAEMRLPNTDIMFVLDTTGSMAQQIPGDSTIKIDGLKKAVKCFFEIVARLDTNATCDGTAPSGGTGNQVQIRFGFVPYSVNVNVGRLLPASYFANTWNYQTRKIRSVGAWSGTSGTGWTDCGLTNSISREYTQTGTRDHWWYGRQCSYDQRSRTVRYDYGKYPIDVSGLKTGDRQSFTYTSNGISQTINWPGCIEERDTTKASTYYPIPAAAKDLNIDLIPTAGDAGSLWAPQLPDMEFVRASSSATRTSDFNRNEVTNTTDEYAKASNYCPTEGVKLQAWPTAADFQNYVDSLTPSGNTYHDIGLLWGARFLSRTGIFGTENNLTPRGGEIDRHLIFMTDGETATNVSDYSAYGVHWFDRRQTSDSSAPDSNATNAQVNARFTALCSAIKAKPEGITLWVIYFGDDANEETTNRLTACATAPKYFFPATDSSELQTAFRKIAEDISQLRLTR